MTRDRPHVCFVAPSAYPLLVNDGAVEIVGGAELQQVIVARGLAARGYPVSMICLDFGQPDQVELDGIRVFRAYRPLEGIPVLRFVWPRLTKVWSCLLRAQAGLYYQRTAVVLTGIVAAFCQRHSKKSVFAAAGEPMIPYGRDYWIYEYGLRHVDRVFVQHAGQARFFQEHYGLSSELVPNCYDVPEDSGSFSGHEVLWVSTIRSIKRPDLFLDLAERLPQYRFTMVGGPGDRERARAFGPIARRC